jgi:hypothetical protein
MGRDNTHVPIIKGPDVGIGSPVGVKVIPTHPKIGLAIGVEALLKLFLPEA